MREQRPRLISQGKTTALETEIPLIAFTSIEITAAEALNFIRCGCPRVQVILPSENNAAYDEGAFIRLLGQLVRPNETFDVKSKRIVEIWRFGKTSQPTGKERNLFAFEEMVTTAIRMAETRNELEIIKFLLKHIDIRFNHDDILKEWERKVYGIFMRDPDTRCYLTLQMRKRIEEQRKLHVLEPVNPHDPEPRD